MSEDFSEFKDVEDFSEFKNLADQKSVSGFAENIGEDTTTLGKALYDIGTEPLDVGVGGVGDIATTAATNLLPKSLVDKLYSYENNPDSMAYKFNETLKNNSVTGDFFNFLSTKPREQYEQMGDIIGKDIQNIIDDPVNYLYEKPVSGLLGLTGAGRVFTTLAKTGKAGQTANKVGAIADKALNYIDPTKPFTKGAGFLADKVKTSQTLAAAQNIIQTKATDLGVKYGFKILPSTIAEKGGNVISRLSEKFVGNKRAITPVVEHNIKQVDKLIRKHANVADNTPLGSIYETLAEKNLPYYTDIAKLKGKNKIVNNRTSEFKYGLKYKDNKKTVNDIQSGQSILNKIEIQKKKNNKTYEDFRKENTSVTQETLNKNAKKINDLHNQLNRTITYNKKLAQKNGASKKELKVFDNMSSNLIKARKNYAIGHSIENALKPDGTFNIKSYADANRNNTSVTNNGRAVIDFYDANPKLFQSAGSTVNQVGADIVKYGGAATATLGLGGPALVAAADTFIPSLLKSNLGQKLINSRTPTGSTVFNLLGNPNVVTPATVIPSLLESSNIKDLKYLRKQ
tara:strand:+ start:217 stop:1926 length:1710 start_codon:yes stop_codon:yes gene_type:complete